MTDLVVVARSEKQAEEGFLQVLLCAEGRSSALRRAPGCDVPDLLPAGLPDASVARCAERDAPVVLAKGRPRGAED